MGLLEILFGRKDGRALEGKGCASCRYYENSSKCRKYPKGIPVEFRTGKVRCAKKVR